MTMRMLYRAAALLNGLAVFGLLLAMHHCISRSDASIWTMGSAVGFLIYFFYLKVIYHPRHFNEEDQCWSLEITGNKAIPAVLLLKPVILAAMGISVVVAIPEHSTKVGWVAIFCSMQLAYYGFGLLAHEK